MDVQMSCVRARRHLILVSNVSALNLIIDLLQVSTVLVLAKYMPVVTNLTLHTTCLNSPKLHSIP